MSKDRLHIPDSTKLKLWALSGGRCEFPSCNKMVWRDGLTLREDNFAHVAHIVGASPAGPRGDTKKSEELQADYGNLILVCLNHSKLIDGKHNADYTVDILRKYKVKHEDRIRRQTSIGPELATTVVRFAANIRERRVDISLSQAYEAVQPRFPLDDKGVLIDFTNRPTSQSTPNWESLAQDITDQVVRDLALGNDRARHEHLSVFALAPIPLLMHFGNQLGNIVPADLYQKHRDTDDWKWKEEPKRDLLTYELQRTKQARQASAVALVLSLSGKVHTSEFRKILPDAPTYEIAIKDPNPEFLQYKSRLQKFRQLYREVLSEIRQRYGNECVIHLFPAIPAPIAVLCGKELLHKSDPSVLVYDNDRLQGGFKPTLTIN